MNKIIIKLKDLPENGLIDFYASWCNPCAIMEPIINNIIEDGIEVVKVDIDENVDLAEYFQIKSIPTYVYIKEGKEKQRLVGEVSEAKLRSIF